MRIHSESEANAAPLTPVLIQLASGRSGSTLLMQLLGTSNEIAFDRTYPFEHRYLEYFLRVLNKPIPFDPQIIDRLALRDAAFRHMWFAFCEVVRAQQPAARFYAEKVSGDFEILTKSGIDYRLLQLVRDPRDTFTSIRAFDKRRGFYGFGRGKWQSERKYLDAWIGSVRNSIGEFARQRKAGGNVMLIRYEEMVQDLSGTAGRVGNWLGTSLLSRQAAASWDEMLHHVTSSSPAASVGRWRTELPPRIRERIDEGLQAEMRDLGYEA